LKNKVRGFSLQQVHLDGGVLQQRAVANRDYLMELDPKYVMQNYYLEACLYEIDFRKCYKGWDSPASGLKGHFLGHWLSACAKYYAASRDMQVKARADFVVSELSRIQDYNGNGWVAGIPEKQMRWLAIGRRAGVPNYNVHKTIMGLYDMYTYADNEQALKVLKGLAGWYVDWIKDLSDEQMAFVLDAETGGMVEVWAQLYELTGEPEHKMLMDRFVRRQLVDGILSDVDILTNMHANTTIPEILGIAKVYDVTGEERLYDAVKAYWKSAVTDRGWFATGGQTSGELWTPPFTIATRLGNRTQEHCTVYNMIRLADWLLQKTGDACYGDYIERNIYNGILAQQNPFTAMPAYFLPTMPGSEKRWGSKTESFWCCHGSVVQAHTVNQQYLFYQDDESLIASVFFPCKLETEIHGVPLQAGMKFDQKVGEMRVLLHHDSGDVHRPNYQKVDISLKAEKPVEFTLKIRAPWWLAGEPQVLVNGEAVATEIVDQYILVKREFSDDVVSVILPKALTLCPTYDDPDLVAVMEGPQVFVGLCDNAPALTLDRNDPAEAFSTREERLWGQWFNIYQTRYQDENITFIPVSEVVDQKYTMYFPIRDKK